MKNASNQLSKSKRAKKQQVQTIESVPQINLQLQKKFQQFLNRSKQQEMKKGIQNLYGRNYVINYNQKYDFEEQWENKKKNFQENNSYEVMNSDNNVLYFYTIALVLVKFVLIWFISIYKCFEINDIELLNIIFTIAVSFTTIENILRYFHMKDIILNLTWTQKIKIFHKEIYLMLYYIYTLINQNLITESPAEISLDYILDILAVFLLIQRTKFLYQLLKVKSYTSIYKNQLKLGDLLMTLIIAAHIFVHSMLFQSILMFLASKFNPEKNWLVKAEITKSGPFVQYIYSFYFSCTTMLTIGYGDIIPVNVAQMGVVLLIEIVGTTILYSGVILFGYLLNEIGYTLSLMRRQTENLEKDISTFSKIQSYYKIDEELVKNAKAFVINNQKPLNELIPEEENQLLLKLNEDLRQCKSQDILEIYRNNYLNIIKSSIFFVCHWSKKLQCQAASKLVKKIYTPDEVLPQQIGKEKIYILITGKLEIYTHQYQGVRKQFKKLLRVIQNNKAVGVSNNTFGYSKVVSNRTIRLNAIAKDFSSVFCLDKASFMQCLSENKLDQEYFFQIKAKIDQSKHCEVWEAPALLNIREHYRPHIISLIKKHIQKLKQCKNTRQFLIRSNKSKEIRSKKIYEHMLEDNIKNEIAHSNSFNEKVHERSLSCLQIQQEEYIKQPNEISQALKSKGPLLTSLNVISSELSKESILENQFQTFKEYLQYFKKNNLTYVLSRLESENSQLTQEIIAKENLENQVKLQESKLFNSSRFLVKKAIQLNQKNSLN